MAPFFSRLFLALAKRGKTADCRERLVQCAGIIAAVIDDGLAVTIENAQLVGHLVRPDHVAPSHLCGLKAEVSGNQVHHALGHQRCFRAASATIRRVRHLVGGDDFPLGGKIVDAIGADEMRNGVVGGAAADRIERAAINQKPIAIGENSSLSVEADLERCGSDRANGMST